VDSATQANRTAWEAASQKHVHEYADLLAQAACGSSLTAAERDLLREVLRGSPEVVHLQSGHGLDDVALVRAGARSVVGVDYSQVAVRAAQRRADELGAACRYVVALVPGAPLADASADLVYTGKGALIWMPDLTLWAHDVVAAGMEILHLWRVPGAFLAPGWRLRGGVERAPAELLRAARPAGSGCDTLNVKRTACPVLAWAPDGFCNWTIFMPSDQLPSASKRADAERNRAKILAAARSAFADPDADVSMAEVSRRAGVGMATLYRNFSGRRELLEALFIDEVNAVCEAARTIEAQTPGAAFTAWLDRFFAFFNTKRHVSSELLRESRDSGPFLSVNRDRVLAAGRPLLAAAQQAREVREDLTLEQILDMIIAVASIDGDTAYSGPILRAALDGLRPSAC
jgi:AcrR family transcriptional regulator